MTRARSMTEGQVTLQASDRGKEADASSTDARPRESGESSGGAGAILDQIRGGVTKRWGDLRRAEDAADEALLKFGANVRDFFRDAVKIQDVSTESGVQRHFVSDGGKRVIHTSRYDAQLHVLHTTPDRFTKDPDGAEFGNWAKGFDAEKKTDDISKDLARYPELRATMESLVPATVPYADFWRRYYFFRHSVETAEARRRDLLKGKSRFRLLGEMLLLTAVAQPHPRTKSSDGVTRTRRTMRQPANRPRSLSGLRQPSPPGQSIPSAARPLGSRS